MEFEIEEATSWKEFEENWTRSLEYLPWFKEPRPADYQPETERQELREEFGRNNHFFLLAKNNSDNVCGVLDFTVLETYAQNGIMVPAAPQEFHSSGVGSALLQYQERILLEKNIDKIRAMLKYRSKENVRWYFDVLKQNGFQEGRPEGYQMMIRIDEINTDLTKDSRLVLENRDDFTIDDFVELCVQTYASTPFDRKVHGWDLSVTEPESIKAMHKMVMDGAFGSSPPELWKVATLNDDPVGYIIGFLSEQKEDMGIIGNLGVLPEYRRSGFAVTLIHQLLKEFANFGRSFAMVGTPTINTPAIRVYSKAGFTEANRVQFFLKRIGHRAIN